ELDLPEELTAGTDQESALISWFDAAESETESEVVSSPTERAGADPFERIDAPSPESVEQLPLIVSEEFALRAGDILLDELERARSGTMGEIVATIQADQDRLIR